MIYKIHELKTLLKEQEKFYIKINSSIQNLRRLLETEIEKLEISLELEGKKHSKLFEALEAIAQGESPGIKPDPKALNGADIKEASGEKSGPC